MFVDTCDPLSSFLLTVGQHKPSQNSRITFWSSLTHKRQEFGLQCLRLYSFEAKRIRAKQIEKPIALMGVSLSMQIAGFL